MTILHRGAGTSLRLARERLLEHGELPPAGLVNETVARSWRRCVDAGLLPSGAQPDTPHLGSAQLARAAERRQELVAHARPVMEYLHEQTRDSGSMVILADDRATLVHALGDTDFLNRAERVALMPGALWHERYRGTNAIGTALLEEAPVVVHGAEHYLERNGFLTCAAAPIAGSDGQLLGVLDISGDQRGRHPHTFGLVRAAAQMIENRLFHARYGSAVRIRFHPLAEGIGTIAEGIVALSQDGWIVGASRAGLSLLGLVGADLGTTPLDRVFDLRLEDLLDWARHRPGEPLLAGGPRGRRLFIRIEPGRAVQACPSRTPTTPEEDALAALDTGDVRLRSALDRARKILGKPISLLLHGETGVGKEVFARAVHDSGPRRSMPFIAVNCAALPESLIESELFGYTSGAFTGARREGTVGRIRESHGGTLFLDEIGDMPLPLQARLLRVLQDRHVTPLGGGKPIEVDFVLICATHRDLKAEMEAGRFRVDLYYRLNGFTLMLPPLRERRDFPALVARLLETSAPGRGVNLEPALAEAFADYAWPGNLRQLANALGTACALLDCGETQIGWQHLSDDLVAELRPPSPSPLPPQHNVGTTGNLRALSDSVIGRTLTAVQGNMSEAARRLGISRNTLYRRLRRSG